MYKLNDTVKDFSLKDDTENTFKLSDYKGSKVLLYFYPKDDTPGCTMEACSFRDNFQNLADIGVNIFGVSKDSLKSHKKFKEKYHLNFPLLVDENGEISREFDVLKEKSMFGKKYVGIERTTFLINEEGKIEYIWKKVNPLNHVQEILDHINQ